MKLYFPRQLNVLIKVEVSLPGVAAVDRLFGMAPVKVFTFGALGTRVAHFSKNFSGIELLGVRSELGSSESLNFFGGQALNSVVVVSH